MAAALLTFVATSVTLAVPAVTPATTEFQAQRVPTCELGQRSGIEIAAAASSFTPSVITGHIYRLRTTPSSGHSRNGAHYARFARVQEGDMSQAIISKWPKSC